MITRYRSVLVTEPMPHPGISKSRCRALLVVLTLVTHGNLYPQGYNADESTRGPVVILSREIEASRGSSNLRPAIQDALATLRKSGGGTVVIPNGDYHLDFPDIASDIDPIPPE